MIEDIILVDILQRILDVFILLYLLHNQGECLDVIEIRVVKLYCNTLCSLFSPKVFKIIDYRSIISRNIGVRNLISESLNLDCSRMSLKSSENERDKS